MRERKRTGRKSGGPAGPGGVITSFVSGMEEFVEGLVAAVGEQRIRLNAAVAEIARMRAGDNGGPPWGKAGDWKGRAAVILESGQWIEADAVVVTAPSWSAAHLFHRSDPELSRGLEEISAASIAVVATGYRREDVAHPLDGFGFLIPRGEGRRTLGTLWPASTFPGRAPANHVLLRSMIGGATDPDAVNLADSGLLEIVAREVNPLLGVKGNPVWTRFFRFPRGIPQYTVGHGGRLERIETQLGKWSNLFLSGTSYYGIAINSSCERGPALAEAVLAAVAPGRAEDRSNSSRPQRLS